MNLYNTNIENLVHKLTNELVGPNNYDARKNIDELLNALQNQFSLIAFEISKLEDELSKANQKIEELQNARAPNRHLDIQLE